MRFGMSCACAAKAVRANTAVDANSSDLDQFMFFSLSHIVVAERISRRSGVGT
jgi:hypothetical protein